MTSLQKWGGFAALYMAMAYIIGIILFIFVLDYPSIVEPSQKVALLIKMPSTVLLTNLLMYVFFGVALIVFTLAINERFRTVAPNTMQVASVMGLIWAGLLIASGMISNAGIDPAIALSKKAPLEAVTYWAGVETVANGLSFANGEILGGIFTLLVSIVGFRTMQLPKALVFIGGLVGILGVVSTIPGLKELTGLFGISQIVWFVWLGFILLLKESNMNMGLR